MLRSLLNWQLLYSKTKLLLLKIKQWTALVGIRLRGSVFISTRKSGNEGKKTVSFCVRKNAEKKKSGINDKKL